MAACTPIGYGCHFSFIPDLSLVLNHFFFSFCLPETSSALSPVYLHIDNGAYGNDHPTIWRSRDLAQDQKAKSAAVGGFKDKVRSVVEASI